MENYHKKKTIGKELYNRNIYIFSFIKPLTYLFQNRTHFTFYTTRALFEVYFLKFIK